MSMQISAIISVHANDNPEWFLQAAISILEQSYPPSELIITQDGKLEQSHYQAIDSLKKHYSQITITSIIEQVNDRGILLRLAVNHAKSDYVAIMDSDDFAHTDRFERQIQIFKSNSEVDVVGSWIKEVYPDTMVDYGYRKVPENHEEILKFAKWRNPINQMTVMFKKSKVIESGNYEPHRYFEDMWLWVRMLNNNCHFYNIQDSLLTVRSGPDMVKRRSGFDYLVQEVKLYYKTYKIGFLTFPQTALLLFIRPPLRLLPKKLLFFIFNKLIHSR